MIYGQQTKKQEFLNKVGIAGVGLAIIFMMIMGSQEYWRGDEMASNYKDDCQKVGGVLLEHKVPMGTTYECSPRYDQGVKQ
jgi:hypothetical protein